MYKKNAMAKTSLKVNESYEGETIEQKINRIVNNKEPITDGAPIIYTDRSEGVKPEYDIRTDRFEVAIDAMDKVTKSHTAKRDQRLGEKALKNMTEEQKNERAIKDEKFNQMWERSGTKPKPNTGETGEKGETK